MEDYFRRNDDSDESGHDEDGEDYSQDYEDFDREREHSEEGSSESKKKKDYFRFSDKWQLNTLLGQREDKLIKEAMNIETEFIAEYFGMDIEKFVTNDYDSHIINSRVRKIRELMMQEPMTNDEQEIAAKCMWLMMNKGVIQRRSAIETPEIAQAKVGEVSNFDKTASQQLSSSVMSTDLFTSDQVQRLSSQAMAAVMNDCYQDLELTLLGNPEIMDKDPLLQDYLNELVLIEQTLANKENEFLTVLNKHGHEKKRTQWGGPKKPMLQRQERESGVKRKEPDTPLEASGMPLKKRIIEPAKFPVVGEEGTQIFVATEPFMRGGKKTVTYQCSTEGSKWPVVIGVQSTD